MNNFLLVVVNIVFLAVGICLGILKVLGLLGCRVVMVALCAMLSCNWALPQLDITYDITFIQGCAIGVISTALKMAFFSNRAGKIL